MSYPQRAIGGHDMNGLNGRALRAATGAGGIAVVTTLVFAADVTAQSLRPPAALARAALEQPVMLRSAHWGVAPPSAPASRPGRAVREDAPPTPNGGGGNILFSVNFDADCSQDPPAPPPSPPSPWPAPLGFTVHNVDGRTPAGAVSYVNQAWIVREDFAFNVADCVMFSTSWYSPAGAADDWAAFPTAAAGPIVPTASTRLRWNAVTYDASYRDGYEVRYSTAGTAVADFLANPVLFSTPAENTAWTARELSLAALAGTPIHLAFRNNSNDKFLLLIDDIVVEHVVQFDPMLVSLGEGSTGGYAKLPVGLGYGFDLTAEVQNAGADALTDVQVDADLRVDAAAIGSLSSPLIASLPSGATQDVSLGSGTYLQLGQWTVDALVSASQADALPANSALSLTLAEVTPNELTRAQGPSLGNLGIGAGNGGELGQDFEIPIPATLTAIRYTFNNIDALPDNTPDPSGDGIGDFNGYEIQAVVRDWNTMTDEPGTVLHTASFTVPVDAPLGEFAVEFAVPNLVLPVGRYLIAAVEPTTPEPRTMTLVQTAERFTPGTVWVNWPTSPLGGWGNVEEFGAAFARTFRISALMRAAVLVPVAVDDALSIDEDQILSDTVADNDSPSDDGGNVWSTTSDVANGTLVFNADGSFEYTPDADYAGPDGFDYQVCDVDLQCDTGTVTLTVTPVDDVPLAAGDNFDVDEDILLTASVSGNDLLSGDGGNVWSLLVDTANGTLTLNPDGSFTYQSGADFNGSDSFQYQLCDADLDCASATVTITIAALDDLVDAVGDSFVFGPEPMLTATVASNDDVGDGGATWTLLVPPASGTLVFRADGSFDYTSAAGSSGALAFNYRLCDVDGDCDEAMAFIQVLPERIFASGFEN